MEYPNKLIWDLLKIQWSNWHLYGVKLRHGILHLYGNKSYNLMTQSRNNLFYPLKYYILAVADLDLELAFSAEKLWSTPLPQKCSPFSLWTLACAPVYEIQGRSMSHLPPWIYLFFDGSQKEFLFQWVYSLECFCISGSNNSYSLLSHPNSSTIVQVFRDGEMD